MQGEFAKHVNIPGVVESSNTSDRDGTTRENRKKVEFSLNPSGLVISAGIPENCLIFWIFYFDLTPSPRQWKSIVDQPSVSFKIYLLLKIDVNKYKVRNELSKRKRPLN